MRNRRGMNKVVEREDERLKAKDIGEATDRERRFGGRGRRQKKYKR